MGNRGIRYDAASVSVSRAYYHGTNISLPDSCAGNTLKTNESEDSPKKFKTFCDRVSHALKTHDPAVNARFDVGGDFYRNREETSPAFSYAFKGNFRLNRRRILTACAGLLALLLLFRRKRK